MPDAAVWYPRARAILHVVFDGMGDDSKDSQPYQVDLMPKAATIHRNRYDQPDSWELTFNAQDLPLDPALIRQAVVEIYLWAAQPNETRTDVAPMIVGRPDDISMEWSASGKWLTMTGQDLTAFLGSKQWPPKPNGVARRIPTGDRLDVWAQRILDEADPDGIMKVAVDKAIDRERLPRVRGDLIRGHKRGIPIEQNTNYWDVLYKVIERHGFIAYVDQRAVVIGRPRNLPNPDDASIRRLAWGRNLENLRFSRKTSKGRTPAVIVTAYDAVSRKHIVVDYPQGALKKAAQFKAGAGAKTNFVEHIKAATPAAKSKSTTQTVRLEDQYFFVDWSSYPDPDLMFQAAKNKYEMMGKGERTIVAVTHDLADLAGADMMDLKAGDACTIDWQDFNREAIANSDLQDAAKLQYLLERGFAAPVAQTIIEHYRKLVDLARPLRVRESTYDFDVDSGIRIEVELHDFVVVDGVRDSSQQVTRDAKRASVKRPDGKPLGYGGAPGRVKAPGAT